MYAIMRDYILNPILVKSLIFFLSFIVFWKFIKDLGQKHDNIVKNLSLS